MTVNRQSSGIRYLKLLLTTLVCLVVADGLITEFLVSQHLGREGNPLLQSLVGTEEFLAIKLAGALLCALIIRNLYRKRPGMALAASLLFVLIYTLLLYWNISFLFGGYGLLS